MGGDVGTFAAAAIGIALSPLPFLLAIALLGTTTPLRNGAAFVSGEACAVAGISTCAVALTTGRASGSLERSLGVLEAGIGIGLAVLLVVHLRRPQRERAGLPWSAVLARVRRPQAFLGGAAMIAVNPKNLALTLAGAAAVVDLGYSPGSRVIGVAAFTVVAVSTLLALVALAAAFPERSTATIGRARASSSCGSGP